MIGKFSYSCIMILFILTMVVPKINSEEKRAIEPIRKKVNKPLTGKRITDRRTLYQLDQREKLQKIWMPIISEKKINSNDEVLVVIYIKREL